MRIVSVEKIRRSEAQGMGGMGSAPKPVPEDFFPPGETFDFYNPMDWARQTEYNAALAAWNVANGIISTGQQVADAALTEALKVAAGIVALKLAYDYFKKQPSSKRK